MGGAFVAFRLSSGGVARLLHLPYPDEPTMGVLVGKVEAAP